MFLHKNSSFFGLTDELPARSESKLILQAQDNEDIEDSGDIDESDDDNDLPLLPGEAIETDMQT